MKSIKVAVITLASHLSKMLVTLYIIKQIAITQGPEGLGFFGNFISLVAIASTLAGGGTISGIIKYVAEYSESLRRQLSFLGSVATYSTFISVIVLIVGLIFLKPITNYIFLDSSYSKYVLFFLVMQCLIAYNNLAFGIVNGLRKNNLYAAFVLTGNVLSSIIAFYGIRYGGTWGIVIAIMAPLVLPFLPIAFYASKQKLLRHLRFDSVLADSKLLSKFSLMLLVSALCFPVVEMIIRNLIINQINLEAAGFWQAITKLSTAYLSFYSLFLTFYFIPIISTTKDKQRIYSETKKMYGLIMGFFGVMALFFFNYKDMIIYYALSPEFVSISDLFLLQMLGDFFRVLGWVLGFIIVAKAATKWYILGELVQGILFLLFATFELSYQPSLQNVIIAYVVTCMCYCLLISAGFYLYLRKEKTALLTF